MSINLTSSVDYHCITSKTLDLNDVDNKEVPLPRMTTKMIPIIVLSMIGYGIGTKMKKEEQKKMAAKEIQGKY